jgi:hypothetical protein
MGTVPPIEPLGRKEILEVIGDLLIVEVGERGVRVSLDADLHAVLSQIGPTTSTGTTATWQTRKVRLRR